MRLRSSSGIVYDYDGPQNQERTSATFPNGTVETFEGRGFEGECAARDPTALSRSSRRTRRRGEVRTRFPNGAVFNYEALGTRSAS